MRTGDKMINNIIERKKSITLFVKVDQPSILPVIIVIKKELSTSALLNFVGSEKAILKMLLDAGKTDVKITYNTNFADLTFKGESVLDYWKEFKQVNVSQNFLVNLKLKIQ